MKHLEIFEKNPSKNELFKTADGYHFWERARAVAHANSLADKSVEHIVRIEDTDSEVIEDEVSVTKDYSKLKLAELKAEAEKRGLTAEGASTKAHYIALLTADDEKLATIADAHNTPDISDEEKAKVAIATDISETTKA